MSNAILTTFNTADLKRFTEAGFWKDETVYLLAREHAQNHPEAFAVRDRFHRYTFSEVLAMADDLADNLAAAGVQVGERVAVWLPSRVEGMVALLACSRNGYVCCPSLHRSHTVDEIVELLTRVRSVAILGEVGYAANLGQKDLASELGRIPGLKYLQLTPPVGPGRRLIPESRLGKAGGTSAIHNDPNTLLYLAFTSGTTGLPKGVMHSDNTLLANARAVAGDWMLDSSSIIYSLGTLSHNLGFGAMITALLVGAELVVHDLARGESALKRIVETRATYLVGVPTHASDLLRELSANPDIKIDALKGFRISGAPASQKVVAELLALGIVPQSGFGMTEACSHHYTLPSDGADRVVETSGKVCPGYEIKIWSNDNPNQEVPFGTVGQIGGRGASLMLGYFDDQAATERSFNDFGWFMTGDLGWVDEAGYLRVTGRKKDVIIRGGHNIHPARIEQLAMKHEAIDKVAVVPVPDERLGERVCLVFKAHAGGKVSFAQILVHLDQVGLSSYDMPEFMFQIEDMPLTASGKVLKRAVQDMIAAKMIIPTPVARETKAAVSVA